MLTDSDLELEPAERITLPPVKGYKRVPFSAPGHPNVRTAVVPDYGTVFVRPGTEDELYGTCHSVWVLPVPLGGWRERPYVWVGRSFLTYGGRPMTRANQQQIIDGEDFGKFWSSAAYLPSGLSGEIVITAGDWGSPAFTLSSVHYGGTPWDPCDDVQDLLPRFAEHHHILAVHRPRGAADASPKMLAYTFSLQHSLEGRDTVIRVRAYLQKYWSEVFTADERERLATAWELSLKPRKVHLLTDGDEIEAAYTSRTFGSCMGHSARSYDSPVHPTRVYANCDLAVAVIFEDGADEDDWSNIAARCIVWPEKKAVGRIYGDVMRMQAALRGAGFDFRNDDFTGARISRIEADDSGCLVMPYLDIADEADDDGKWIVLGRCGDLETSRTDGLSADPEDRAYCERCEDEYNPGYEGGSVITYISSRRFGHNCESWCDHCMGAHSSYCEYLDETVTDDLIVGEGPNGERYSSAALDSGDYFICTDDGHIYSTCHRAVAEDTGDDYHEDSDEIAWCDEDGCYYTVGYVRPEDAEGDDGDDEEEEAAA